MAIAAAVPPRSFVPSVSASLPGRISVAERGAECPLFGTSAGPPFAPPHACHASQRVDRWRARCSCVDDKAGTDDEGSNDDGGRVLAAIEARKDGRTVHPTNP